MKTHAIRFASVIDIFTPAGVKIGARDDDARGHDTMLVLWPPSHKMVLVTVTVTAVATDICDDNPVFEVTAVSSNDPVGKTSPDWQILGGLLVNLPAERLGSGFLALGAACQQPSARD